jgi:hypothetical protein
MTNIVTTSSTALESPSLSSAVDRLVVAIRTASFVSAEDIYAPDARLDATVPGWRFKLSGENEIRDEYGRWFANPNELSELSRLATADGEVVEYFATWTQDDEVHGAHHVHVITVDRSRDRIMEEHVFCGGRWPSSLLAEMGAPMFTSEPTHAT